MDNEYQIRLIYEYNPRLSDRTIEVPEFRRDLYKEIRSGIPKKQVIAIVGLRRTGKTTLMRQLMDETGNPLTGRKSCTSPRGSPFSHKPFNPVRLVLNW